MIIHRYILERFFQKVFFFLMDSLTVAPVSVALKPIIKTLGFDPNKKDPKRDYPPMSKINEILVNYPAIKNIVWERFGLDCELPRLPPELLYGALSTIIHNPGEQYIFVSDLSSGEYKNFFIQISSLCDRAVKLFDEELAEEASVEDVLSEN